MKLLLQILALVAVFANGTPGRGGADGGRVTVFAAASLKGALDEVADAFDGDVRLSFGGSGGIARQVALGAPADVVILANVDWMDWLEQRGVIVPGDRADVISNRLVLVAGAGAGAGTSGVDPGTIEAALGRDGRLAVGQVNAVPAGLYAKEWLTGTGQWDALEPRLAQTENVRAALALVARGETPLGIVYASDAAADPGVWVVYEVPYAAHSDIRYPAALVQGSGGNGSGGGGGGAFLAWLQSAQVAEIFARHGFAPLGAGN